jgi:hypothetical protein
VLRRFPQFVLELNDKRARRDERTSDAEVV